MCSLSEPREPSIWWFPINAHVWCSLFPCLFMKAHFKVMIATLKPFMNVKSSFKLIWRVMGRKSEYVVWLPNAQASGLSSALLGSQGRYLCVFKLHCPIFQHEIAQEPLHYRWSDMFCNLYTCDLFRSMWRWPTETQVTWVSALFPYNGFSTASPGLRGWTLSDVRHSDSS